MIGQGHILNQRIAVGGILVTYLLSGNTQQPGSCPAQPPTDLSKVIASSGDDQLPFRFPLDELGEDVRPLPAIFCTSGGTGSAREYHAAEDYHLPAGRPVYAMADGILSYSGPQGGYGWLIIIDHPQANLYSLYGHLSPSRWKLETGPVEKGDLIAYLGDPDENGGSPARPLRPHLHFGIRAGQRADYPGIGEWRWQAGWISLCPQDLGWLQPSAVITGQDIPADGFPEPAGWSVAIWWRELLFAGIYLFGGTSMLVFAIKKNKPLVLILSCGVLVATGWYFYNEGWKMSYAIFAMAVLCLTIGIYKFIRRSASMIRTQS